MKTTNKNVKTNESEVKQELKVAITLWLHNSKSNIEYLTGFADDNKELRVVGFFNTNKKNPKEPDVRIYLHDDQDKKEPIASLWDNVSESKGTKYLSGTTNENEKLVGFYGKENENLRPYIRVYYNK